MAHDHFKSPLGPKKGRENPKHYFFSPGQDTTQAKSKDIVNKSETKSKAEADLVDSWKSSERNGALFCFHFQMV